MAVDLRPNSGPGSFEYTPGLETFVGINCALAGDRITFVGWKFKDPARGISNVIPDSDGYMPHFAIYPVYSRDANIGSTGMSVVQDSFGAPLSGNIDMFPIVRVDLGSIWLPYAARVVIQGGNGPGHPAGVLLITLAWERRGWHMKNGGSVPVVEKRDEKVPFTIYNKVAGDVIERPVNALDVFCPDGVDLTLSNGAGSYSSIASMGPRAGGVPTSLGPFSEIVPLANTSSIRFTVKV